LTTTAGGGTVNFLTPAGDVVDERVVAAESSAVGISLCTKCFCNPGAGENAFGIDERELRRAQVRSLDDYLRLVGWRTAGAVRGGLGCGDVERFIVFAEATYRDRVPDISGLPPREPD
jgi:hypothetical protein